MNPRRAIAPVLLPLAASCADESRAREIACQQRLVDISAGISAARGHGESGMGAPYARLSKNLHEMELDGCSKGQAHSAEALSKLAGEIAGAARSAEGALENREATPQDRQAIMILADRIERFERRRKILREELAEMKGQGKRPE